MAGLVACGFDCWSTDVYAWCLCYGVRDRRYVVLLICVEEFIDEKESL